MLRKRDGIRIAAGLALSSVSWPALAVRPSEPGHEEAPYSQQRFLYLNDLGDLHAKMTSSDAPLHFFGDSSVSNADYTRGAFSGVSDNSSTVTMPIDLSAVFEIAKGRKSQFDQMAFTLGMANDIASDTPAGVAPGANFPRWYKSDYYVGFAAHLAGEWIGGLTYSIFTSPNELLAPTGHEAALTARYTGGFSPQLKLVEPTDSAPGTFASASIRPSFDLGHKKGLKLLVPIEIGTGMNDYYGPGSGSASYGSAGFTFTLPFGAKQYGVWDLAVGADAIYRDDTIAATGGPSADHDNLVWDASVAVKFYY